MDAETFAGILRQFTHTNLAAKRCLRAELCVCVCRFGGSGKLTHLLIIPNVRNCFMDATDCAKPNPGSLHDGDN